MKKIFLFSILITTVSCVSKSYTPYTPPKPLPTSEVVNDIPQDDGDPIYMAVETPPSFPGGMEALSRFYVNLKFPQEAKEQGIHGKVYAQFVVEKDGSLSNISIRRSVHPLLDNEALRFIKLMPKWIPGEQNRKKSKGKIHYAHQLYTKIKSKPYEKHHLHFYSVSLCKLHHCEKRKRTKR